MYWISRARATDRVPIIQRQPQATIAAPVVPHPIPQPVATLVVPVPAATIEVVPGTKRFRVESEDLEELASIQPPAKRRIPAVGGERWPSFILPKDASSAGGIARTEWENVLLPPTREQREHIQKTLGGNWRFAKTLHQHSLGRGGSKWGFPARSTFLFVQLDEAGVIVDRIVVKCTDLSRDNEYVLEKCVRREEAVVSALATAQCSHLPQYRQPSTQNAKFTIEFANPQNKESESLDSALRLY
jgi:hypothetical protein